MDRSCLGLLWSRGVPRVPVLRVAFPGAVIEMRREPQERPIHLILHGSYTLCGLPWIEERFYYVSAWRRGLGRSHPMCPTCVLLDLSALAEK